MDLYIAHKNELKIDYCSKKIFQKNIFKELLAIKFNSFQLKLIYTLTYATIWVQKCFPSKVNQLIFTICLMTMKKKQQKQAKTKNSVEKCEKNVWKPFKP